MITHKIFFIGIPIIIIFGSLVGLSYYTQTSSPTTQGPSLFISSVTKGSRTISGIELRINITLYSATSFTIYGSPYLNPCLGSVKLINNMNWALNNSLIYYCPLFLRNKTSFNPGTYKSVYPVYLVPLNGKTNVPFPSELSLQVSSMNNEFTSPTFTAKF